MSNDVLLLAGLVGAHFALERLGARVDPPVLVELRGGQEVFSAVGANVLPLGGVGFHVFPERPLVLVGLAAQVAHGVPNPLMEFCVDFVRFFEGRTDLRLKEIGSTADEIGKKENRKEFIRLASRSRHQKSEKNLINFVPL